MGLVVSRVVVERFRNWDRFELEPHPSLTIIVGPNAVGKTSLIEAIELLTETVSFRRPAWPEVVKWGEAEARLTLEAEGEGRSLLTELTISSSGRRTYSINGKVRRRVSEVTGVVPCVTFTPDDLRLIKDSAEKRRNSLDSVGVQLSPTYARLKQEYEKLVRQRNALLKEPRIDEASMQSWSERLVELGSRFVTHRRRLFDRMAGPLEETYASLAGGERLKASYQPSWTRDGIGAPDDEASSAIRNHLEVKAGEERSRRMTLAGPHRDEIRFEIEGREARAYASQGQQRTVALAWKLAEVGVITEIGSQPPVLLLDDVMSELDETRRHSLAAFVGSAAQTFVTTTNLGYFEKTLLERAKIVDLS